MSDEDDWTPGDVTSMIANPFYAINIDKGLAVPHEPLISEDDWVEANVRLIEELGAEPYLRNLLSVLKGNYPRGLQPPRAHLTHLDVRAHQPKLLGDLRPGWAGLRSL